MAVEQQRQEELYEQIQGLRKQLQRAQRLACLGLLASSVAHEFNNILTSIVNYAKLAMNERDEHRRRTSLEKVQKAARRAAQITNGILGLSRARGDQRQLTNLAEMVKEIMVLVEKDLSKHRVRLHTHFASQPHAVVAPAQIQQILLNLIVNARQAMPNGGHLRLEVRESRQENLAQIVVADTGTGIPADQLPHIFDPFFTTKDGPDGTGKGGTGIGLAVCREIIEAHGGRIRVESLVGRGTTFIVKLPLAPPPKRAVP